MATGKYWMPHDELCYAPADVVSSTSKAVVLHYQGVEKTVMLENANEVVLSTITQDYSNLEMLEDFSEPAILYQIRKRFLQDLIYTYVSNIVIAVNPYQSLIDKQTGESIYGASFVREYINRLKGNTLDRCDPHVFGVAARAFLGMCTTGKRQSVLISGESGAGKTETTKKVLYFLSSLVREKEDDEENEEKKEKEKEKKKKKKEKKKGEQTIEDKIMLSNPILESFGNAQTVMNDNSSRFGKWMEIFFDSVPASVVAKENKGKIIPSCGNNGWTMLGGAITSYILEKSRVSFQMPGERNFHIFYMILESLNDQQRIKYKLPKNGTEYQNHAYVRKDGFTTIPNRNELNEWNEMHEAFQTLGFDEDAIESILSTVAAIIHLGDLVFEEDGEGGGDEGGDGGGGGGGRGGNSEELGSTSKMSDASLPSLEAAAALLKVNPNVLANTMLIHQTRLFTRPRSPDKAASARDALSKDLYRRLFDYLVETINVTLGLEGTSRHQIGVLDIFGFEIFDTNSFEQLCINYANESLQRHFNKVITEGERAMYTAEGVPFDHMEVREYLFFFFIFFFHKL